MSLTVTGSSEPTKLTQVTAGLVALVPSTAMVNMGGGEEVEEDEEEEEEERVRSAR